MNNFIQKLSLKYPKDSAFNILRSIISHVLNNKKIYILDDLKLTDLQIKKISDLIDLHVDQNKPLQYILGSIPFIDSEILVAPPILIPRPETEEWVYNLLNQYSDFKNETLNIVEVGTGSGCIAISLAKYFINSKVFALDINSDALELALKNAKLNNVSNVEFIKSDIFSNFKERVDLIVSNPPYISFKEYLQLDSSVKDWEDERALVSGEDGLNVIRGIIEQAPKILNKNKFVLPRIFIEMDINQGDLIKDIFLKNGLKSDILKDFSGRDRVSVGY